MWIPSHSGIHGNEKADKIAKFATNSSAGETKQITYQEADHWLREETKKNWNTRYRNSETAKHYRQLFPTIFETTSQEHLSRRCQVIIFRLQTGQCQLRAHLYKIGQADSQLCTYCSSEETVHARSTSKLNIILRQMR